MSKRRFGHCQYRLRKLGYQTGERILEILKGKSPNQIQVEGLRETTLVINERIAKNMEFLSNKKCSKGLFFMNKKKEGIIMLVATLEQSLIFAIMVLGVYLSFKILNFPDMTVDGSFPLGAAVSARLLMEGVNPYITLLFALFSGAFAGAITGILHSKLKIQDLLTGILVMTALYSVNLRIMGKSNIPLFEVDTIFRRNTLFYVLLYFIVFC